MEIRHFLLSVNDGNGKLIATETVSMQTNGRKSSPTRRLGFSVAGFGAPKPGFVATNRRVVLPQIQTMGAVRGSRARVWSGRPRYSARRPGCTGEGPQRGQQGK